MDVRQSTSDVRIAGSIDTAGLRQIETGRNSATLPLSDVDRENGSTMKRVAAAVGEGSSAVRSVHERLASQTQKRLPS